MNAQTILSSQRQHLEDLLEAIQRCTYFLDASSRQIEWPLSGEFLVRHKKDNDLFEALAAVNERFSKLQDTLGAAMRHSLNLSGEQADSFLKTLSIFEKFGVINSIEDWQVARTARNLAAHDYQIDYVLVAEHFNTLNSLYTELIQTAKRFIDYCEIQLLIKPATSDFSLDFLRINAALSKSS
jgi:hypothetical protein